MLGLILDGGALAAARAALTGLSRRHEATSANIANIDTPGYQRRGVQFEAALRQTLRSQLDGPDDPRILRRTHEGHLAAGSGPGGSQRGSVPRDLISSRNDGNNVSIDEEMLILADTQIRFQALTQTLGRRLNTLRSVIRG